MTIRLEDLRRAHYKQLCNCSDPAYCIQTGSRFSTTPTFEPVTASEVASVLSDDDLRSELQARAPEDIANLCTTAELLGELVRRGVLRTEQAPVWIDAWHVKEGEWISRFVSNWTEPVGSVGETP